MQRSEKVLRPPTKKKFNQREKKYCLTLMKDDPLPDWNVQKHSHSLSLCCFFLNWEYLISSHMQYIIFRWWSTDLLFNKSYVYNVWGQDKKPSKTSKMWLLFQPCVKMENLSGEKGKTQNTFLNNVFLRRSIREDHFFSLSFTSKK